MLGTIKMIPQRWITLAIYLLGTFFLLAWLLSMVELFLAHTGVNYQQKNTFVNRHLYRISPLFFEQKVVGHSRVSQSATQSYATLGSWKLQALYKEGDLGFAVVLISGKTHFVNKLESLQGYTLKEIEDKRAYFFRGGQMYKLSLDTLESRVDTFIQEKEEPLNIKRLQSGVVTRSELNSRIKNPRLIWSDISISIYRKGGEIKGFFVKSVKHGSIFSHLGLKRGDIIVSANGETLDSLEKVQTLYTNIDKIHALVIGVKRSNKIEELRYEIK